jgi:hypothetical protein
LKSTTKAEPLLDVLHAAAVMAATTSSTVGRGMPVRRSVGMRPKILVLTKKGWTVLCGAKEK